jgi:hypothetical protein
VLKESENAAIISSYSNAATLHDKTQDQSAQDKSDQKAENPMNNKSSNEKFRRRKCVCDEMHLFRECPYIVTSARKPEWKESPTIKNEARQRIFKNALFQTAIKAITNTDILDGLDDDETAQKENTETAELNEMTSFKFGNVAISTSVKSAPKNKNPLSNSVIYDSDCNQALTYDKTRFIDEITPAHE